MRYIGGGDFIQGVPARDLTRDEWEALEEILAAAALAAGVYELAVVADGEKE